MRAAVNGLCKLATRCLVYIIWAAGFRACGAAFAVYITTLHNFNFDLSECMFGYFSRYYVNGARPLEVARFSPRDATYMDFIWSFHMVSRHSFFLKIGRIQGSSYRASACFLETIAKIAISLLIWHDLPIFEKIIKIFDKRSFKWKSLNRI